MKPRCSRGACCQGYCHHSAPNPNPPPQQVTEVPRQHKETATRKKAGPKKPEPKPTAAAQPAARSQKRKEPRVSKPRPLNPQLPSWWSPPTHSRKSPISSIAFPSKHVWSSLVGSSHPSPPSPQGQPANGLS